MAHLYSGSGRLSTVILCVTTRCNLSCRYCYMECRPDGEDMGAEVLSSSIKLISLHQPQRVQITGGEPLLYKGLRKAVVEISRASPKSIISIQTNGTLINREWAQFFKKFHVDLGISIDGTPEVNNKIRGKSERVFKNLGLLREEGVPFGVTVVVTSVNCLDIHRLSLLLGAFPNFLGLGLDFLTRRGRAMCERGLFPDEATLKDGFEMLLDSIRFMRAQGRNIYLRELKRFSSKGQSGPFCHMEANSALSIHPNGCLYPCGHLLGDDRFFIGKINDFLGKRISPPYPISLRSKDILRECTNCEIRHFCPGDCPARTFYNRIGCLDLGTTATCILNKIFARSFESVQQ